MSKEGLDVSPEAAGNGAVGLKAFMNVIGSALMNVPEQWVRCELRTLTVTDRYTRMEFVEPGDDGKPVASLKGGCFPDVWQSITQRFAEAGVTLVAGSAVLVKLKVSSHPTFGLSAMVIDVDAMFALGDTKAREQRIRKALEDAGVWQKNKALPKPVDFQRVAVIAPEGAAGLGDFRSTADQMAALGLTQFDYFTAPFQTANAAERIVAELRNVFAAARDGKYCAVALIRGGGASTDLLWLTDQSLVRAICLMNVPVMTGIGHERDKTLLDEVACMPFDTPSKVVEHIKATVVDCARSAEQAIFNIVPHVARVVGQVQSGITAAKSAVQIGLQERLRIVQTEVANAGAVIERHARNTLQSMDARANGLSQAIDRGVRERLRKAESGMRDASLLAGPASRSFLEHAESRLTAQVVSIERAVLECLRLVEGGVRDIARSADPLARQALEACDRSLAETQIKIKKLSDQRVESARSAVNAYAGQVRGVAETIVRHAEFGVRGVNEGIRLCAELLPQAVMEKVARLRNEIEFLAANQAEEASQNIRAFSHRVTDDANSVLDRCAYAIGMVRQRADALDPRNVLAAGYAILRDGDGAPLTTAAVARCSDIVKAEMRDGIVELRG